ncbi:type II toxin-antitoxin system death-on-curing family toxin [Streptomyces sp. MZ04]|uniref:type II toxin-antitoxin system death-on-curing family toxin n=1 Tax=Streptomyces sp. MZ04 TaxID=2559236 RepID=UPI00107E8583|nr:type II toxin-antitoxin system death-on-curing family toxin [Streptomyces sp. MZ04]TGB12983.1 type II toxin-antitoxin system death-on-curing family toxin [Streptomyces sp. MZ04]
MKYLTVQEVLDLAEVACGEQQIAVRDLGLLTSAVHRPQSQMYGVEAYTDLFEKAASLLQSLATNRPLVDGNKRMAWMSTAVFLDFNGTDMVGVDQDETYKLVIEVASGVLEDVELIARRLRALHEGM